jgi:DNA-binding NtrC family response regulator
LAQAKILVIDDEPDIGWLFSKILSEEGYKVLVSLNGEEGISTIEKEQPDLVFLDLKLPGKSGIQILREIRKCNKDLLVIVLTAYETVKTAVEAMKLGAYDYLSKPVNIEKIKTTLKNALSTQALIKAAALRPKATEKTKFDHIVGESLQMQEILDLVKKAAPHDITVLLRGASGTGKELIAREIHSRSKRANKPFVAIDCAILPDTLVESEIFGHERGAFTGANERKLGKFELAQKGTVFLDEIGNLTPQIQVKLLRSLQEREIERLGGKKPIKVDVRLIAATNMNLEKAISTGRFREDLYYRLNVFSISLPLLRERGNVRELRNVIESATLLAGDIILPQHMPLKIQETIEQNIEAPLSLKKVAKHARYKAEKELITKVLNEVNWNKSRAAKILKVDYKTLYNKIKEYNIGRS